MTTISQVQPSEDFETRCREIQLAWRSAALPFDEAIKQMNMLVEEAKNLSHQANYARALNFLGTMHGYRGKYKAALTCFQQAHGIFAELGNKRHMAIADLNLGETYRNQGQYHLAQRLFHSAYETAKEFNDATLQMVSIVNEGLMLLNLGHLDSANRAFEKGYQLANLVPETESVRNATLCEIHYGLAAIHLENGRLPNAYYHAQQAVLEAQKTNQPLSIGIAFRTMGTVLAAFDPQPDDPEAAFNEAYAAFRKIEAEGELARTMYEHGRYLIKSGQRLRAGKRLQNAMVIFARLGMTAEAAKAAEAQNAVF